MYGGLACRMAKIPYAVNITGLGTAFQGNGMLRKIVTQMYKAGCTYDDVQQAVEDGAREYRILIGEEE